MRAASAAIAFEAAGEQALKGKAAPGPGLARPARRRPARRRRAARTCPSRRSSVATRSCACSRTSSPRPGATGGRGSSRSPVRAGIGKSRLAWELEKYIDGIVETIYWHRGRSPAYGEGITFWALGEMVRRRAGLAETDDEATTRERIARDRGRVRARPTTTGAGSSRPCSRCSGLEPAPAGGRDVLFAAWRIFFERIAERGTTVLALRGPPVGRLGPARLHRAPPRVVEGRPAPRRDAGPTRALRAPPGLGQPRRGT